MVWPALIFSFRFLDSSIYNQFKMKSTGVLSIDLPKYHRRAGKIIPSFSVVPAFHFAAIGLLLFVRVLGFELHQARGPSKPVHRPFIFLFVLFENIGEFFIFYHARSTDFEEKIEGL